MPNSSNNPELSVSPYRMLSATLETQPTVDVLLASGSMLLATAIKGWAENWPVEGWLGVAVLGAAVLLVVVLDRATLRWHPPKLEIRNQS